MAKGFGFAIPPRVNLNVSAVGDKTTKRGGGGGFGDASKRRMSDHHGARPSEGDVKKKAAAMASMMRGSGHAFSAGNPYGKRASGDTRQFSR